MPTRLPILTSRATPGQEQSQVYNVGHPYEKLGKAYQQSFIYNIRYGHHEAALCLNHIEPSDVVRFNHHPIQFGYWWDEPVLWMLAKFGTEPWSDASFSIHKVQPPEARHIESLKTPNTRYPINLILVEATTGIVTALRTATMSPKMSMEIFQKVTRQMELPANLKRFDRRVNIVQNKFIPNHIAIMANKIETIGENTAPES